jgi:glycosyltransferase involved in cell wall biosynthesis
MTITAGIDINNIKVSIVTPVYNSATWLSETIQSVLSQTHTNWEMLITDDCSTDNSFEIASNFARNDKRIKLNRLPKNSGSGIARNTSIKKAQGDVVAFLDSDDLWDSVFLKKSLQFMEERQAGIVFSSYRRRSEDLKTDLGEFIVPKSTHYTDILKSCPISCLTGMYHIQRCGGKVMMPNIKRRQDYCLWLTLLKRVGKAHGIKDVLATYRICRNSVSRNKVKVASYQWLVYRKMENLPYLSALYYFAHYAFRGSIKNYALLRLF